MTGAPRRGMAGRGRDGPGAAVGQAASGTIGTHGAARPGARGQRVGRVQQQRQEPGSPGSADPHRLAAGLGRRGASRGWARTAAALLAAGCRCILGPTAAAREPPAAWEVDPPRRALVFALGAELGVLFFDDTPHWDFAGSLVFTDRASGVRPVVRFTGQLWAQIPALVR